MTGEEYQEVEDHLDELPTQLREALMGSEYTQFLPYAFFDFVLTPGCYGPATQCMGCFLYKKDPALLRSFVLNDLKLLGAIEKKYDGPFCALTPVL